MRVFFTCSTNQIKDYYSFYRAIRDGIISQGNQLTKDWIDYSINVAKKGIPDISPDDMYKDTVAAILMADVFIADVTVQDMPLGNQIMLALQKDKPVLLLRYKISESSGDKLFIEGSNNINLNVEIYRNISEVPKILKRFFRKYEHKTKHRFNLILTAGQDQYLQWSAFHYKKTKTEIIHESIDKMSLSDSVYRNFLSKQL